MPSADLPLHYGRVPTWLASRMAKLGGAIVESIVLEYGKAEVLRRLSDPLWFQSFGAVLGMDWHSSGITTSVVGALKRALNSKAHELGIYVCGGRGKHSRNTPRELYQVGERTGLDANDLARSSRLVAKIDNTVVQDGYQIYLHAFFLTDEGDWAVVQQGMNTKSRYARRYHWSSEQLESYVNEPHASVCGQHQGLILNLTHRKAQATRSGMLEITREHPTRMMEEIAKIRMPARHDVKAKDVNLKRLGSVLALTQDIEVANFETLLLLQGVGPRTVQSLALVSEVIHGTASRFDDPARYSFAHGGKDGRPFPVPTKVYDRTIDTLRTAVERAKIGRTDRQQALKRLHEQARRIEGTFVPNDNFDKLIEEEWASSNLWGGRTTFDSKQTASRRRSGPANGQLTLFPRQLRY